MSKQFLGSVYHAGRQMIWSKGVKFGDFIFLSGVEGRDETTDLPPPSIEAQTQIALNRIKQRLEEAGSSIEDVVKFVWYIAKREQKERFLKARDEWFAGKAPSSLKRHYAGTLLLDIGLDLPEMLIEIDVIAVARASSRSTVLNESI